MNICKMLTSRVGAVNKIALLSTSVVVGALGLNLYDYATSRPAAQEAKVRSLAAIISSGGSLPREYSGISLSVGNTAFATPEEMARFQGQQTFDGGESQLARMDQAFVQGQVFRGGEAGLGLDNGAELLDGNAGGSGVGGANRADKAIADAMTALGRAKQGQGTGSSTANGQGSTRGNFQTVSRNWGSGGHNLGAGNNGGFGSSAYREGQSRVGASSISGVMPDGNTLLAVNERLKGARSASYVPSSRETRTMYGEGSSNTGTWLRTVAEQSAKTAANKDRAVNEGSRPLLSGQHLAGGLVLSDNMEMVEPELEGIGDDSYLGKMDMELPKLNTKLNEIDTTEQEKSLARSNLIRKAVVLLFATIAAMLAIALLKNTAPWAAAAITVALAAVFAGFAISIGKYVKLCHGEWDAAAVGFTALETLFVAGVGLAWTHGVATWIKQATIKVAKFFGVETADLTAIGKGAASVVTSSGQKIMQGTLSGTDNEQA